MNTASSAATPPQEALSIGAYVRNLRRGMGMTQSQLAGRAFVSCRTIGEIESGAQLRPRSDTLGAIELALAVPPGTLLAFVSRTNARAAKRRGRSEPPLVGWDDELVFALRTLRARKSLTLSGPPGCGIRRFVRELEAGAGASCRPLIRVSATRSREPRSLVLNPLAPADAHKLFLQSLAAPGRVKGDGLDELCRRVDLRAGLIVKLARRIGSLGVDGAAKDLAVAATFGELDPAYDAIWSDLSPGARRAFAALGLFARRCVPAALVRITECDDLTAVLDDLHDHFLIGEMDGTSYPLSESVIAHARSRRAAQAGPSFERRFVAWSISASKAMDEAIESDTSAQLAAIDPLIDEYERAVDLARSNDLMDDALGLAAKLWYYYWSKGLAARGLALLRPLLEHIERNDSTVAKHAAANAYARAASLAHSGSGGSLKLAERWSERAVVLATAAGDEKRTLQALISASSIAWERGDVERSRDLSERALQLAQEQHDEAALAAIYNNLGALSEESGEFDQALEAYRSAAALFTGAKPTMARAYTQANIGTMLARSGRPRESLAILRDAFRCARAADAHAAVVLCLRELAETYLLLGKSKRAAALAALALESARQSNDIFDLIGAMETAAHALVESDPAKAAEHYGAVDALRLRTDRKRRPPAEQRRSTDLAKLSAMLGAAAVEKHRLNGVARNLKAAV